MSLLGLPTGNTNTSATAPAVIPSATNGYIQLPITVDPNQLTADAFAFIAQQIPGWIPREGHLESWLIESLAQMVSQAANVAANVPVAIFMFFGSLVGINPENGSPASASTTWTVANSNGYTIPQGTTVAYTTPSNALILFQTVATVTIPAGQTQTSAGQVQIQAVAIGTTGNGYATGTLTLIDSLSYVVSIVSTTITTGGTDAETVSAYVGRLSNELQLLTPRPILGSDFAALAPSVPGVFRAVGIDNWNAYGNLVSAVDSSFETGIGTAANAVNATLTQSPAQAQNGTYSLAVTSIASGMMSFQLGPYPVAAGQQYTAVLSSRAAATPQIAQATILWYSAIGTPAGTPSNVGIAADDTASAWTQVTVAATAPTGANFAYVELVYATTNTATEVHYVDEVGLFLGTNTTWAIGGAQGGQERMVTVVPVDANGNALDSMIMTALQTYLSGLRETNFLVYVVPPTYTPITVVVQAVAIPTAPVTAVELGITAALTTYLSPATWAGGGQTPPVWLEDFTVHYLNVAGIILGVPGVQSITSLTLNGGTSDIPLTGTASLPVPTLSVNVTAGIIGT